MKLNKFSPLILLLALLAGCAAPTPLPPNSTSVPPTDTSTPTEPQIPAKATSTPTAPCPSNAHDPEGCYILPTETLIPTATSYLPLSTNGPYLAYLRETKKQTFIVFLDANGAGRKEVLLPDDISNQMWGLNNLSPDGKWLAYYTGEPDSFQRQSDLPYQGPHDLALNLLNLETKEAKLVTPLLSKDFPNNFQQQVDIFRDTNMPDELPDELQYPGFNNANILYITFLNGIRSLAWSPDGRYLAFAGQMNGLSSDIYVYDMKSETIRQLSSGPEEIQWISWSPDGKGILHGATYVAQMAMECRTYIADLDGTSVRYLSKSINCFYPTPKDWIDNFTYLEHDNQNVIGNYHLRSVDTRTGGITTYWDGAFEAYAVDLKHGTIALGASRDTLPVSSDGFTSGLYLIDIASRENERLIDGVFFPRYFGVGERRFVILTGEVGENNLFLKTDGTLMPMESNYETILVAPDQQHWVGMSGDKAFVFSADNTLIREINFRKTSGDTSQVKFVTWSPDSLGFYFQFQRSDHPLYFVYLLSGDPILIEQTPSRMYEESPAFKWILIK